MARDKLMQRLLRERFIFTLSTGETFDGLLIDADEKTVQIFDAYALIHKANGNVDRLQVDSGEMFLPRDKVSYMQRPGAVE